MNNIDWSFFLAAIGLITTVIALFINKNIFFNKKNNENRIKKFIPIFMVLALISSVFVINYYYTKKLQDEKEHYELILKQINYENSNITNQNKIVAIDSLKSVEKQLNAIIENISKQEKITGRNSELLKAAEIKRQRTNVLIKKIKSYNEVIDKNLILKNKEGYTVEGETSNFEFYCPTDKTSDYVDLVIYFHDQKLIEKIDYIMLEVSEKKDENSYNYIFEEIYKPQSGINAFRIKNYLKKPNMVLQIGYVLKTEKKKTSPRFEQKTCYSY